MTLRTCVNGVRGMFAFARHLGRRGRIPALFGLAILTECASLSPEAPRSSPHVYILYALGGIPTSLGMVDLADRIKNLGDITVSAYSWDAYNSVIADIAAQPPDAPVALIGYSLGANATSWIANSMPHRRIALLIAYDPSIWYPVSSLGDNVDRAILYHNNGIDPLGHARIKAPRLETIETWLPHVTVDFDESLHKHTVAAVERQLLSTGKIPATAPAPAGGPGWASQRQTKAAGERAEPMSGVPGQLPEPPGRPAASSWPGAASAAAEPPG
jgi:hypothetical protein